jgi:hypothetical protein
MQIKRSIEVLRSWDSLAIIKKYFVVDVGVTNVFFSIAFGTTYCVLSRLILGKQY